ncbi:serine threonine kinase [Brachionus plicatilis]|uniref:Serine threonine kinase n=1 Tax=Brachionus plicatilis TaxID=10195 RepID=A0A3M7RRV2_BRAPC|nr:serine threonine kinase [Brachionus plicatilis]
MDEKKSLKADFFNKYLDYEDVKETMNYFGLNFHYCLGKTFSQCVSKIEEIDDNEKLLISSFGNKMKIGKYKFDQLQIPKNYIYFILNKKKDIILACGKNHVGIYLIHSKLFYPKYFEMNLSHLALIENRYIILSFTQENYIEIQYWENFFQDNMNKVRHLVGHTDSVHYMCTVDDDHLLSGSNDSTIKYWKISALECVRTFVGHRGFVNSLMLLGNSKMFVSGSDDTTLKLWNLETGECLITFIGHGNIIDDIQETKNGEVVSMDRDGVLNFWNIKNGSLMLSLSNGKNDSWSCFRILESGKLVTGSEGGVIQIWSNEQIIFDYLENYGSRKKVCNIL